MNNKKTVLTISIVLGLGIVIGVVATELIVQNKKDSTSTSKTTVSTKPLSPTLVSKNQDTYLNQQISLTGQVIKTNNADLYIVGSEKEKPGAIKLDTSTNSVDASKYITQTVAATGTNANTSSPPPATPGTDEKSSPTPSAGTKTVVITGKLTQLPSKQAVLVVQKIQ